MRKLIVTFLFLIFISTSAFAQSSNSKMLSQIENSMFGIEYTNEKESTRLERIEEYIYGEKKTGSIKVRIDNLNKDAAVAQMGKEISPKKDTFADDESTMYQEKSKVAQAKNYVEPEEKADASIEYPVINDLEKQVFGKEYKKLDIKTRLANLEKQAFRKTYDDDLSTRVDRLKDKLAYNIQRQNSYDDEVNQDDDFLAYQDNQHMNYYQPQQAQNFDNYYSPKTMQQNTLQDDFIDKQIKDRDFRSKLNKMEKNVFKQSFSSDSADNILSRLESAVFNTNFTNDSDRTRLNRLNGAISAQKTAKKYDSNSFQQKMAAALQIGMMVLMVVVMIL